jgi:uncharacterized lipoprotein YmbA
MTSIFPPRAAAEARSPLPRVPRWTLPLVPRWPLLVPRLPLRLVPRWPLFCALLLAACGHSAPTRLFTLTASPGAGKGAARYDGPPIQLESVVMPPGLDGARIVRRESATVVEARDTEHWSAPLGQLVRQTLTQDLAARLPEGVLYPDAPRPDATAGIVVDVLDCEDLGSGLVLDASWSVFKPDRSGLAFRGETRITSSSAANADAMAGAMSTALSQLADALASDLAAHPRAGN